jgi:hypothetical protein
MSSSNPDKNGLRKQAFYDSHTSYKVNIDKYKNISDPILQQKDRYVSNINILINYFYRKQKSTKPTSNQRIILRQ